MLHEAAQKRHSDVCMGNMVIRYSRFVSGWRELAKIGPIVRIAPNEVAIADPEAVRTIYSAHSCFTKASPPPRRTESHLTDTC
jgi:hypothetical protein